MPTNHVDVPGFVLAKEAPGLWSRRDARVADADARSVGGSWSQLVHGSSAGSGGFSAASALEEPDSGDSGDLTQEAAQAKHRMATMEGKPISTSNKCITTSDKNILVAFC